VFPAIGYWLFKQEDFGLWCAIAIHDTSSVAAANKYGPQALQIATTVIRVMDYGCIVHILK
jgi:uncharacterized membrane protein YadS